MKKHVVFAGFVLCVAVAAFVHGGTELEMRGRTLWRSLPNGGVYHPGPVVVNVVELRDGVWGGICLR